MPRVPKPFWNIFCNFGSSFFGTRSARVKASSKTLLKLTLNVELEMRSLNKKTIFCLVNNLLLLSITHTHKLSILLSLVLSIALSHAHTHTHTHSHFFILTCISSLSLFLIHTHTHSINKAQLFSARPSLDDILIPNGSLSAHKLEHGFFRGRKV